MLTVEIMCRLENIQIVSDDIIENRMALWNSILNGESDLLLNVNFQQWPSEELTLGDGWLDTQSYQNAPYNNFCPIDLAGGGEKSVSGCPAVAMAQIVNYHQTTKNVSFDDGDDYYHGYYNNFWIDDDQTRISDLLIKSSYSHDHYTA